MNIQTNTSQDTGSRRRARRWRMVGATIAAVGATACPNASALGGADVGTAISASVKGAGYALVSASGGQYNYANSDFTGSLAGTRLNAPVVDAAGKPDGNVGWLAASDGGVFAMRGAPFYGSMGDKHLNAPIVAIVASRDGAGYLLVAADGGTFAFGNYPFPGSLAGTHLNAPVVDAALAPGGGIWLVAADGGVFALGGAPFYGSMGGKPLNQPITSIVPSADGGGYLLVAEDGGTFAFGNSRSPGSLAGMRLNAPVVDAARAPGGGLWMLARDGGVFALSAQFFGAATKEANAPAPPVGGVLTGASGGTVAVSCPAGGSITVSSQIGSQLAQMLAAARAGGVSLCGSGWRRWQDQVRLRKQNCKTGREASDYDIYEKSSMKCHPPTAKPGTSMHEKGLAVDFDKCAGGSKCFNWLKQNAAGYGLRNFSDEPWHWSTTGK